jgi:hypothetical protein
MFRQVQLWQLDVENCIGMVPDQYGEQIFGENSCVLCKCQYNKHWVRMDYCRKFRPAHERSPRIKPQASLLGVGMFVYTRVRC